MRLWRSIQHAFLFLLLLLALVYAADYLVLRYRVSHGDGLQSILVKRMLVVHLKGNKIEYTPLDSVQEVCTRSVFPQLGHSPCWYLRRHPREQITY